MLDIECLMGVLKDHLLEKLMSVEVRKTCTLAVASGTCEILECNRMNVLEPI